MTRVSAVASVVVVALAAASAAAAQPALPFPQIGAMRDIAGARELPDPGLDYKVVFDLAAGGKLDAPHPGLVRVARYLNTLVKAGVPAERRHIAVVFHNEASEVILRNEAYAARNGGRSNASLELLEQLKAQGVDFRVCGQSVVGRNMPAAGISAAVQTDLAATVTLVNLQLRGFVLVAE